MLRGERCLFRDLSFALNAGELLLVQGANGSGKTSLLRAISGLLGFETGDLRWRGVPTARDRQSFHAEIVWLAHRVGFKGDLTLIENLRFETGLRAASLAGLEAVLERLSLSRLTALPLRSLSAGQQRRVALARMLISDARLWLMDEPFANLDAAGQRLVIGLVAEHLAAGGASIVAAHQDVQIDAPTHRILLQ